MVKAGSLVETSLNVKLVTKFVSGIFSVTDQLIFEMSWVYQIVWHVRSLAVGLDLGSSV